MAARRLVLALLLPLALLAPARAATLFEDIGGHPMLERLVARMLANSQADPRISAKFDNANLDRLKTRLVAYLCTVTGGGCDFHGISIKGAHAGLDLTDAHFNALVEDMQDAMDQLDIPFRTQNRLLAILAPLHADIVTR